MTPTPEGKERLERLTTWARWKRLQLNRISSKRDVSTDELWESKNLHLEDIEALLSQAKAAEAANMSKDDFQKIAEKVAAGYGGIGGLSHGLYLDFAYDCFRAAYEKSREGL